MDRLGHHSHAHRLLRRPRRAKLSVAAMAERWLAGKINLRETTRVR